MQNLLRSFGGECTCISLPYWDWGEEAAKMITNGCTTKEECSPTMKEWGGGGSVDSTYMSVPVFNTPEGTEPVEFATGYCVLNDITKRWRSNYILGQRKTSTFNATCPTIRRGWNDWRDTAEGHNYASPMVSTSFLSLASSLGGLRTYRDFSPVLNGQVHSTYLIF